MSRNGTLAKSFCGGACGWAVWLVGLILVLPPSHVAGFDGRGSTAGAPRCEVPVQLMAVVYHHQKPERSLAMVVHDGDPARLVGVGSRVARMHVVAVLPKALWLAAQDELCWLPLVHESRSRPKARTGRKHKKKKKKRRRR